MKNSILVAAALISLLSANSYANDCSGDIAVPSLTCMNPVGGADVRLYMMEFQTCKAGKITELDRSITGLYVVSETKLEDIHSIDADNMDIVYSEKRSAIDAKYRVDDLTFLMPKSVKMNDGDKTIEMNITDKTELDYNGAGPDQNHFIGSFKIVKADGKVYKKGKLICFVTR